MTSHFFLDGMSDFVCLIVIFIWQQVFIIVEKTFIYKKACIQINKLCFIHTYTPKWKRKLNIFLMFTYYSFFDITVKIIALNL